MSRPFDYAPDRPDHIDQILNGLDRYNPETTTVFQDYVMQQCENQTYDCYANLALLKLYVSAFLLGRLHYFLIWGFQ
jgi:translation initiation factor 3 subunit K